MRFHPDVLACHAQFGGDLADMQRRYDAGPTAPTEKAAPIPEDVAKLAIEHTPKFAELDWPQYEAVRLAIARAIMQDRADRASQEERIREDEREVEALALAFKARSFARWLRNGNAADVRPEADDYDELAGMIEHLWRERVDALAIVASLRGGAS